MSGASPKSQKTRGFSAPNYAEGINEKQDKKREECPGKVLCFMNGEMRRQKILESIKSSPQPLSGAELAKQFQVSRQVIVQDIALLRVARHDIVSTNRGYILNGPQTWQRVFKVLHGEEDIVDELNTIVDQGGKVVDVFVNHKIYGKLRAEMQIRSRRDVEEFMKDIHSGKSAPLMNTTSGYHYHTVEAEVENVLNLVENALKEKNYLVEEYSKRI